MSFNPFHSFRGRGTSPLVLAVAIACPVHGVARADCTPVLSGYAKAESTKRYAVYEVDAIGAKPNGLPIVVVIGDFHYAQQFDTKKPLDFKPEGYRKERHDADFEIDDLKKRVAKGAARCESLGERKSNGITADGWLIRDTGTGQDYGAIALWIDRATGLPVMHGPGPARGGFGWVYGATVVVPPGVH